MLNNKVSILIPLYNSEKYISETIKCCLQQTYNNIEIIIVDDGSTDNSYQIAKRYESDKIKIYRQKNNGASHARNFAFRLSSGDYIQYLDADDMIAPDKIEKCIAIINKKNNLNISFCSWSTFKTDINKSQLKLNQIYKDYKSGAELLIDMWLSGEMMPPLCWFIPRYLIEKAGLWDENLTKNDDGEFFCRVLLNAEYVHFCEKTSVYYRKDNIHSLSRTMNRNAALSDLLSYQLYESHTKNIQNKNRSTALAYNYFAFYCRYYPLFPDLLITAKQHVINLGFKDFIIPQRLPFYYQLMNIFGVNNVLSIINYLKNK